MTTKGRAVPEPASPAFSTPVVVDLSQMRISDIKTIALAVRMQRSSDPMDAVMMLPEVIDMLDRLVEGGVETRPHTELWDIFNEVSKAINGAGNPKT